MFLVSFGKGFFFFLLHFNERNGPCQVPQRPAHMSVWKVIQPLPVTWETSGQVLRQCFLGDGFSRGVHCRDGQAQDFPEWNELRLTDGRHADG